MLNVSIDSFSYQQKEILHDIVFTVREGEHLALMGESGSGKSTVLRILYGLLHLENGALSWRGEPILGPNYRLIPGESYMKYLSQSFDLMPFTSVRENVAKYLSVFSSIPAEERIEELMELVDMRDFIDTKVRYLSGGQQQRVALASVLAEEPEILLLDEPFGHIDNFQRGELRRKLFAYLKERNITVVTASHDASDILSFAQNTLILKEGQVIIHEDTGKLYANPPNRYAGGLFGEINLIPIKLLRPQFQGTEQILLYPHEWHLTSPETGMRTDVVNSYFKGSHYLNEGRAPNGDKLFFNSVASQKQGTTVFLEVSQNVIELRNRITS